MHHISHILSCIKESVQLASPGASIVLYGSYARGDVHEDSDIDMLILVDQQQLSRLEKDAISFLLYDIGCQYDVRIRLKI